MKQTILFFCALLGLVACATPAAAPVISPAMASKEFPTKFKTVDGKRLAGLEIDLTGIEPAPPGYDHAAWLILDGDKPILLGRANAPYVDPAGENLVGKAIGVWMSLESSADLQANKLAKPNAAAWFAGRIPNGIVPQVRQLVARADDTPNGMPYDPGLKDQALLAAQHGQLAQDALNAGDLKSGRMHVEHVWNILSGKTAPEFGDLNGDGQTQNPGDSYGTSPYARKVAAITDQIRETPGLETRLQQAAVGMGVCARHVVETWNKQAREQGRLILAASDVAAAQAAAKVMVSALNAAAKGVDANGNGKIEALAGECGATQIYELSHELFDVRLKLAKPAQ